MGRFKGANSKRKKKYRFRSVVWLPSYVVLEDYGYVFSTAC